MASWVARIHQTPFRGVMAITGGGSLAISDLLTVPGASRTLLEAHVPYSASSLAEYLGSPPEQACSDRTARALAMAGFHRALRLDSAETHPGDSSHTGDEAGAELRPWWGIGCTASLGSDRPKRGTHRFHLALQTADLTQSVSVGLVKDARSRLDEERLTADFLLHLVAQACGLSEHPAPSMKHGETVSWSRHPAPPGASDLLLGRATAVRYAGDSAISNQSSDVLTREEAHRRGLVLFPGAFNPPHPGHERMAAVAERKLGRAVELEISLENVDKPPLDYRELSQRLAPLRQQHRTVWLTRAATFVKKAEIFPEATFVVGADTAIRIADVHYYDSPASRDAALDALCRLGCRFLVFGRLVGQQFLTLQQLPLPGQLRAISQAVAAEEFREDISSTALRRRHQAGSMTGGDAPDQGPC
jgi:hypothetical protein